ncbi:MAG: alpha-glucan family phosphorylase [Planctomycetes bacterium]|nr:alpha-glucan family phosphorylase [Planctomycetota bacterium]
MRPLRTFTIEPSLPDQLKPLLEIVRNLWWCWQGDAQDLFRRLAPDEWKTTYHNPAAMLGMISQQRLIDMASDEGFLTHMQRVHRDLKSYMANQGWWIKTFGGDMTPQVAYFCAEFGISESLPIYAGGLGMLAGDHLKSASELGVPLVGVGLLYQQGYFRQRLNADGWQLELFPRNDFHNMSIQPARNADGAPLIIQVEMPQPVKALVWHSQIGRVSLYLLDTNVADNSPEDRQITAQLYGGDQEMRIRQEIVLGIGGVRMLAAMGIAPKAFHMNEGHAAFMALERIRTLMNECGIPFNVAREAVIASTIFTTHTPVPAGNDAFAPWMIDKYFSNYWGQLGLSRDDFLALGRQQSGNKDEPMNLTVLALRLSSFRNGVSKLHGEVSRKLWANVWPGLPLGDVPITSITNGVHVRSWISHDLATLYERYLGPNWHEKPADIQAWKAIDHIPNTELWRTHERRRERLVAFARQRLLAQLTKRGGSAAEMAAAEEVLDPEALTIGFARRFATYKRANLILSDLERLDKILNNPRLRVQIIFAGKAHPRDNPGKDLVRQIIHTARLEQFRRSLVFIEDYDMNVARYLVQGVDVWLNTPLRPMEASGTSGMKVAANGGLNLSVLDGWWDEGYDTEVGWAIGSGESYEDLDYQNTVESHALYDLLEKEVVPIFYDRGHDKLPRRWIARMKACMSRLAPVYNTNRMVMQYSQQAYAPAAARWNDLTAKNMEKARHLSDWRNRVRDHFGEVRVERVNDNMDSLGGARIGTPVQVEAVVNLGQLQPEDISVQLFHGPLDGSGQLVDGQSIDMNLAAKEDGSKARYAVQMPCGRSGLAGYTVRILPRLDATSDPYGMGLTKWA